MWIWFGFAALALIGEVASGTFYLLLVALGAIAAGVAAWFSLAFEWQLLVCIIVALGGLVTLRKTKVLKKREVNAARNADVHMDIGQTVMVDAWSEQGLSTVLYRGAQWQAQLAQGCPRHSGPHTITEVRGTRFIVTPQSSGASSP